MNMFGALERAKVSQIERVPRVHRDKLDPPMFLADSELHSNESTDHRENEQPLPNTGRHHPFAQHQDEGAHWIWVGSVKDHTSAPTHPIIVHPRKIFSTNMALRW